MDKVGLRNNTNAVGIPFKIIAFIIVVCCIGILIFVWCGTLPVMCDPEDKVELQGQLLGFYRNGSFWDVKLDNQTYVFNVFDRDYLINMVGYTVVINACFRHDTTYQVGYYDLISSFIISGIE